MSNFSTGKKSKAISDRSGMAFPYQEMMKEWNGSFVHRSEFETKHPQIEKKDHKADSQSLQNARPDRTENAVPNLLKTITVVDVNTYTFTVSTDTATTGNITGGGFRSYAGPATLVA